MTAFETGFQNIVAGQGVPIAIVGMTIVMAALGVIASSIAVMPRVLRWFALVVPEPVSQLPGAHDNDEAELAAAAAAAFHAAHGGAA
jgi:Na+-transporting methylmalonyl-CoA/oxaloacetate decarboxylase gamma subunit